MINRLLDKRTIEHIYAEYQKKSGILLLYARTGVGKSYLMDHIFSQKKDSCYIRVLINQQEAEEAKGLYISCMAKALNKYAHETTKFLTIEGFIENIYTIDKDREKVINDLLDVAADLIKATTIKEKLDQNKKFKKDLVEKVLQNDNDVAVSFLLNYIVFICKEKKIVVSIENMQHANKRLISFLNELLKETPNLFLIGEYTIDSSEDELIKLFKELPFQNTEIFELKKLNKQELIGGVRQITGENSHGEICEIIENSYDESHGNLVKLELLLKKNSRPRNISISKGFQAVKYDDVIHSIYTNLDNSQKIILWYIITHLGKVHSKIFNQFIKNHNFETVDPSETLEILEYLGLITTSSSYLNLAHDSFVELLKQEEDCKKFMLIANRDWLDFYREITIKDDIDDFIRLEINSEDIFILQLTFILNIGGNGNLDWMNVILSKINDSITSTVNYSLISKVTSIFYQVVETNSNSNLIYKTYEWIVIILSKLGHWEEISKIQERYKPTDPSNLLFLLQCSARIVTCDPTVGIELEKINATNDVFLYIGSQLLLIRYYRTFNQIKKSRLLWKKLINIKEKTPYGDIILDQINLCSFNVRKRHKFMEVSKDGHRNAKNKYHCCSTLLNLNANSYYLYRLKLISKKRFLAIASDTLQEAKEILPLTYYPMHAFLNQKSIFQLVSGNVHKDTIISNFQTAYMNCGIAGNKPLIGSNIVAVALKHGDISGIRDYVDQLMIMSRKYSELNSEFSKYPLINCYNYFRKIKDKKGQKEVMNLLRKGKTFNSVGDYLIMIPFLSEFFIRKIKYLPCNIYNWDIDFETIQAKF